MRERKVLFFVYWREVPKVPAHFEGVESEILCAIINLGRVKTKIPVS